MTAQVYGATDKVAKAGDTMTGTLVLNGTTPLQIPTGAAAGSVPTSDASGNLTLQALPAASPSGTGGVRLAGDLGGTSSSPTVVATHLTAPLPIAQGGTGASTATAGLAALSGTPIFAVRAITASTVTANAWDALECNATSNTITVTLPTNTAGTRVVIKKTDSSANAVTISGTVDGVTNPTLTFQYQSAELLGDGTNWYRTVRPAVANLADYPATTDARYMATSANLDNTNGPNDQGFIAWTGDSACTSTSAAPASGGVRLQRIILRRAATISYIWMTVVAAGATLTAGQSLVGLYNSTGTLLGSSADQSTSWTSTGIKQMALTTPYSAAAGTYYVAFLSVGTTPPGFAVLSGLSTGSANANLTVSTGRTLSGPGAQTSLPSSITMTSNTFNQSAYWCAVS